MGTLVLNGATSGSTTIQPTDAATVTATLPGATGTVMVSGNMPAFSAYVNSSQSLSANTATKLGFNATTFDTASAYNTSLYRFNATVAGYYQVNACVRVLLGTQSNQTIETFLNLYKNASAQQRGADNVGTQIYSPGWFGMVFNSIIYLAANDYIEMYAFVGGGSGGPYTVTVDSSTSYWNACLLRTA